MKSAIDFAAMANLHDNDDKAPIKNLADQPKTILPVSGLGSRQGLAD